jgi:hypothetical protein
MNTTAGRDKMWLLVLAAFHCHGVCLGGLGDSHVGGWMLDGHIPSYQPSISSVVGLISWFFFPFFFFLSGV